jgi:PD-(D/E)XK endonuclease
MKKRTPKIIKDNKQRGEWAESVFTARAAENGLPVSKPSGDSTSFDCVVGRPGKFVAVQVKCTVAELRKRKGYICSVCSGRKVYRARAFDFLAAYVVPEDAWYIVPASLIRGQGSICLCSSEPKYEEYREAWHLLRTPLLAKAARNGAPEASGGEESHFSQNQGEMGHPPMSEPEETAMGPGLGRIQGAMNSFRHYLEKGGRAPR